MKKIYFLIVSSLILSSANSVAQQSNIAPGNVIAMLNSDSDVHELLSELQTIDGIKTDLKINKVLSASMHIYLFDFNASSINEEKMLNTIRK